MKWKILKERILDEYKSRNLKSDRRIRALDKVEQFICGNYPNLRNKMEEFLLIPKEEIEKSYKYFMQLDLHKAEESVINEIYKQLNSLTTQKGNINLKLYQVRAKIALPYLVCYAKASRTIYYSKLADDNIAPVVPSIAVFWYRNLSY